jgi:hypothetical protein
MGCRDFTTRVELSEARDRRRGDIPGFHRTETPWGCRVSHSFAFATSPHPSCSPPWLDIRPGYGQWQIKWLTSTPDRCAVPQDCYAFFLTAILTGMRLGELLAMKGAIWTGIRVNIL